MRCCGQAAAIQAAGLVRTATVGSPLVAPLPHAAWVRASPASCDAGPQAVVHMEKPGWPQAVVDDEQRGDRRTGSSAPAPRPARCAAVIVFGSRCMTSPTLRASNRVVHVPPQIAVGDDADKPAIGVAKHRRSRSSWPSSPGSLRTSALPARRAALGAGMHDVADPQEAPAELAARMKPLEIGGRKTLCARAARSRAHRRAPASSSSRWSAPAPSGRPRRQPAATARRRPPRRGSSRARR